MKRAKQILPPLLILVTNILIAHRLFRLEYSAHLGSNEGQFIAIARQVAAHPGDLLWWPLWDCGMPFQNTYSPLLPLMAGALSRITGHSAALAFHQVTAAAFCLGPVCLYFLALAISRARVSSFLIALFYSVLSPCAFLIPEIRQDLGGLWRLRRLQILAFYGEGAHTLTMMLAPLAILFLYLALTRRASRHAVLAGVFFGLAMLANAFGAVVISLAAASAIAAWGRGRLWRSIGLVVAVGALGYLWISPLLPPSVIAAIRMNSPTVAGDYRFTARSFAGVAALVAGFLAVWWLAARRNWPAHMTFSVLFAWLTTGIVMLGALAHIYVVPQPHRYQIAMDMALSMAGVFASAELFRRVPKRAAVWVTAALVLLLALQARRDVRYGRGLIQSVDITRTVPYRMARWADANLHGARAMISGSYSFWFSDFTDTPQLHGGQDPMLPNFTMRHAVYFLYSGSAAGAGEQGVLWLKALGAHAISVPGPHSPENDHPFANPAKFEGLLPVLWREGDDTIYGVPARSTSLAHVMDAGSVVRDRPVNGLDVREIARYVEALEDPRYPEAAWRWTSRHSAAIHAQVAPGQVVATEITWSPGWRATWNGAEQPVSADGLGMLTIRPACNGTCDLSLGYDGGSELRATIVASAVVVLFVAVMAVAAVRRRMRGALVYADVAGATPGAGAGGQNCI